MDEQRAEFEAWAHKAHYNLGVGPNGLYQSGRTSSAWASWQAATQRQQERIAELEAALHLARDEVAYMASGMTHADWKTRQAQKTLKAIDTAIAAGKGEG